MFSPGSLRAAVFANVAAAVVFAGSACVAAEEAPSPAAIEFFEKKIRPTLVAHCHECHSAEAAAKGKLKAGLAVDTRAALLRGGESGPAVVPGDPEASLLLKAIRHDADASEMPPSADKLSDAVIADFTQWIRDGAADPRTGEAVAIKRGMSVEEGRKFWSFVPPWPVAPPKPKDAAWPRSAVDAFVRAKQEERGLAPLPDASPRVLARRLYFDLIGLPPTPEEVEEFVARHDEASRSPDSQAAIETLLSETVDRLLARPQFGERWGRHWLDAVRYADSNGRDRNMYFFHAWRYRDYVIDSFNADKPFDEFVEEQIAGDLMVEFEPDRRDELLVATGFLALGGKAFEELNKLVFRADVIDDQIEVVGRSMLGLSIGCARCHDHKFDPIPTADYYALAGVFRSTETLHGFGPKGIKSNEHTQSTYLPVGPDAEKLAAAGYEYFAKLQNLTHEQNNSRVLRYRVVRNLSAKKLELQKPDADKPALEAEIAAMEAEIKDWDVKVKAAEKALQAAMDESPSMPGWAMGVRDRSQAEDAPIYVRGDVKNLGPVTPRGVLQVCGPKVGPIAAGSGRLELAKWVASRENPLTARVFVNRAWLHLFGRGLVTTPDDFGVNGARPSHPELLDYLAFQFMEDGWSVKKIVKSLVLTRAYRIASHASSEHAELTRRQTELDPDGATFWRARPRRLEAELIRDAVMSAAGTLDLARPTAERQFLAKYNPHREDEYRPFQPLFAPADVQFEFRSVYLPVVRGVLPEVFQLFDFASPDRPVAQRDESVVPAQSLYFMNSPWVIAQATAAAKRLLSEPHPDDAARVIRLYRLAYARSPSDEELSRALRFVNDAATPAVDPKQPTPSVERLREERFASLCQVVFASAEFLYVR